MKKKAIALLFRNHVKAELKINEILISMYELDFFGHIQ